MLIVDGSGGHDGRFEAIYRKYYARVWRYFRGNGISDDESHDLAQDAFKRLYERMNTIRNEEAWPLLAAIAKTILLNRVRARQTLKRGAPTIDIDDPELVAAEPEAPPQPDYAEQQESERRVRLLITAVATLPQGQRECLRLRIQNRKYEEIAKILGITLDAVKSRLRDAKKALREQLGDKLGDKR
jgi:RNA polymerase sigma-70 factor (ECF subfamily)